MTLANGLPAERRAAVEPGLRADIVVEREHFAVEVAVQAAVGETVAVMGPSGAGKSTLLQALAGLEPLTAGQIDVAGRVVDRVSAPRVRTTPMNRGIVLLGQDARLFPHLSVRENVAFGPRAAGADAGSARDLADEWLARVGLRGAGGRMPRELSGGEGQRVAVARALAASPRAVLLDEPLVALDPATAGDIRQMLRDQLAGITTIAVTHDAADAVALAERLVIIEAGRVTQSGPVRAVLSAPASEFVASIAGSIAWRGSLRAAPGGTEICTSRPRMPARSRSPQSTAPLSLRSSAPSTCASSTPRIRMPGAPRSRDSSPPSPVCACRPRDAPSMSPSPTLPCSRREMRSTCG